MFFFPLSKQIFPLNMCKISFDEQSSEVRNIHVCRSGMCNFLLPPPFAFILAHRTLLKMKSVNVHEDAAWIGTFCSLVTNIASPSVRRQECWITVRLSFEMEIVLLGCQWKRTSLVFLKFYTKQYSRPVRRPPQLRCYNIPRLSVENSCPQGYGCFGDRVRGTLERNWITVPLMNYHSF
jgi:hypothetical protein